MKILKFRFQVERVVSVDMPEGARPLSVGMQNGIPCLWALCPDRPSVPTAIYVVGTGWSIEHMPDVTFVGHLRDLDGGFEWFVFMEREAP